MKKILGLLFLVCVMSMLGAQEAGPIRFAGASVASGVSLDHNTSGGFVEMGLPLSGGSEVEVRNYFSVSITKGLDASNLSLNEKTTFGTYQPERLRMYGFVDLGIGTWSTSTIDFFDGIYGWHAFAGAGIDLLVLPEFSFFVEYAGGVRGYISSPAISGHEGASSLLRLGSRLFGK